MMMKHNEQRMNLSQFLDEVKTKVQRQLNVAVCASSPPKITDRTLLDAIQYVIQDGVKRIRPALVYATAALFPHDEAALEAAACAIELIHTYSLVHDDLPAMDNDDLRRGRPTCHVQFGEAIAILVGDALQALAFETIAHIPPDPHNPYRHIEMVKCLARASGTFGMVGGQAIDIHAEGKLIDLQSLQTMHSLKTGALITASVQLACYAAKTPLPQNKIDALTCYAHALGITFQIQDDILDSTRTSEILGKTAGKDENQAKSTYVSLLGLKEAQQQCHYWHDKAVTALSVFDEGQDLLITLADYIIERTF